MTELFESSLADDLEAFLFFKRSLGYKYTAGYRHLKSFDRFCLAKGADGFSKELVEEWIILTQENKEHMNLSWVSPVRELGRYLRSKGKTNAYVSSDRFKSRCYRPTPYLLSEAEIDAFFLACAQIESKRKELRRLLLLALYQTMHALGLRTCEVRNLACADVDLESATMDIVWSKGPRNRRLYLSSELQQYLGEYDERVSFYLPGREAFFPSFLGNFPSATYVSKNFSLLWDAAGLKRPVDGPKPRAYDFRHHFAFANIAKWQQQGKNVEAMLPYLMRFMGHSSLSSTHCYIHVSPDFLAGFAEQAKMTEAILPEVIWDD